MKIGGPDKGVNYHPRSKLRLGEAVTNWHSYWKDSWLANEAIIARSRGDDLMDPWEKRRGDENDEIMRQIGTGEVERFYVGERRPTGYINLSEWTSVQIKAGIYQNQCRHCKEWRFRFELTIGGWCANECRKF